MANYQNTKCFYSNNGTETQSLQCTSSSMESCAPTQETSEAASSHPLAKPYATAAEAQMWTAVDMLQQLEVKLRPIYESLSLMHRNVIQEKSELLEQQNKIMPRIMQAFETILESITVIERKLTQISDLPAAGGQGVTHSWCPYQPFHESSDECLSLPEILLVRADDRRTLTGYQLDGQPTCAFVACRNDYLKIEQLLKDKNIRNIRYCVGNCGENKLAEDITHVQPMAACAGVTGHFEFKKEWLKDDDETVRSKIIGRNNGEEVEKTDLWSAVASILGKRDDAGSITVRVKDVKEAYEEKQQLETNVMQLNSTISECNKLLDEKQQAIDDLRGRLAQISGNLDNEQGQVDKIISQNEMMFEFLNRKLPDAVSVTENNRPGNNTQPQRTGERVPRAGRPQLSASSQCPKLGSQQLQENQLFNGERLFKATPNNSDHNPTDRKPTNLKPNATFTPKKLESFSTGSYANSAKGEVKTTPKPLKTVKSEDEGLCDDTIKAKPIQTTKSAARSGSESDGDSSSSSDSSSSFKSSKKSSSNSSDSKQSSSTTLTVSNAEQSETSLTDGEGKDTEKPLTDSGDKIEVIKQQVRSYVPKNKLNTQNQSNFSPNDIGTSVDPYDSKV